MALPKFAHAPMFNTIAEKLMGFPVRYWVDESLIKMPGGLPTDWHRDSGSTDTSVFAPPHSQMMVWIALDHIPPERLIPAPDCGMKYIPRDVAFAKLKALAEGAAIVRRELTGC